MKKVIIFLLVFFASFSYVNAQVLQETKIEYNDPEIPTSIGIVIYSNDVETVWNALRYANYAQEWGNKVSIFLLGKGVEVEGLMNTNNDIKEQIQIFLDQNGVIYGCQTCFKARNETNKICKLGCIQDLYDLTKKNKIVLTF